MKNYNPSRAIAALYRMGQILLRAKLNNLGIRVQHADTLYAISKEEGLTQKELGDLLMVSKPAITQSVSNLISLGYVTKEPDEKDKRVFHLFLTEKGRDIVFDLNEAFGELVELHEKSLTPREREQLEGLLIKLADGLEKEKKQLHQY